VLAMINGPAVGQKGVEAMKIVAKEGTWELRRGKDGFTNKPSCVMTVAKKPYIQIGRASLSVSYRNRGGIQSYQVRLDDEPEGEMTLPSEIEKQAALLVFEKDAFETIMKTKRIRIRVATASSSIVTDDIDMKGADRLHAKLRDLCPEETRQKK